MKTKKGLAILMLIISVKLMANNPLIKDVGMSDPHVRIFNDTAYLYCGHDDSPTDYPWVMKEWRVFRSTDLVNWDQVSTISTKDNYMPDDSEECWAGDAAMRNGKYYFYFSHQKYSIGVMTADKPRGHYVDALGKPLVAPMHDPTIIFDDDANKTPYIVYGDKAGGGYHIARLNDDMISRAEDPKPIIINGDEWDASPVWMDKSFIFKHKDTYYLSWGRDYAISKDIYGPYECVGPVGISDMKYPLDQYAHGSFFNYKGQFYHCWCYYIDIRYKYRETVMTYCHMDDDGKIVTDTRFLDQHYAYGVGRYDAAWNKIEAEWFTSKSDDIKKRGTRKEGFKLTELSNGSYLSFSNVDFGKKNREKMILSVSNLAKGTIISIRKGNKDGEEIAKTKLKKAISDTDFQELTLDLEKVDGINDIFIVFEGKTQGGKLDWISFNYKKEQKH